MHDPGTFGVVVAVPKDGDAAKAEAELLKQAENIAAQPITAQAYLEERLREIKLK